MLNRVASVSQNGAAGVLCCRTVELRVGPGGFWFLVCVFTILFPDTGDCGGLFVPCIKMYRYDWFS